MNDPRTNDSLDLETLRFTKRLRRALAASGSYRTTQTSASGNIADGPGFVFEATDRVSGLTFNIEIAGPAYES